MEKDSIVPSETKDTVDEMNSPSTGRGRAVVTIIAMLAVAAVLAASAVRSLFFGEGSNEEERKAFETIMRYEKDCQLDSLYDALGEYFDLYNSDAFHFSQLKALNDRFVGEYDEWKAVEENMTLDEVHCFLDHYPDGYYHEQAERCEDSLYYAAALAEGTVEALEAYIDAWEDGAYAEEARKRVVECIDSCAKAAMMDSVAIGNEAGVNVEEKVEVNEEDALPESHQSESLEGQRKRHERDDNDGSGLDAGWE